jgi:hypothetical protein
VGRNNDLLAYPHRARDRDHRVSSNDIFQRRSVRVALAINLTVVCWDGPSFCANQYEEMAEASACGPPTLPYLAEQPHENERTGDMFSRLLGQSYARSACMKCVIGATAFEILQFWTCRGVKS